ncbi:hypothetical protein [Treponema sp. R6D11]
MSADIPIEVIKKLTQDDSLPANKSKADYLRSIQEDFLKKIESPEFGQTAETLAKEQAYELEFAKREIAYEEMDKLFNYVLKDNEAFAATEHERRFMELAMFEKTKEKTGIEAPQKLIDEVDASAREVKWQILEDDELFEGFKQYGTSEKLDANALAKADDLIRREGVEKVVHAAKMLEREGAYDKGTLNKLTQFIGSRVR